MNTDNLHELIDRYETKIDKIYGKTYTRRQMTADVSLLTIG